MIAKEQFCGDNDRKQFDRSQWGSRMSKLDHDKGHLNEQVIPL